MIVFLVVAQCWDYYCLSCGTGHVVGVALTEDEAERIAGEARMDDRWYKVEIEGPHDANAILAC